jgi:hypothetical protein
VERKLGIILCADVYGYSRLMEEDEEATHRTLTSYRKLIDSLIEQHRARQFRRRRRARGIRQRRQRRPMRGRNPEHTQGEDREPSIRAADGISHRDQPIKRRRDRRRRPNLRRRRQRRRAAGESRRTRRHLQSQPTSMTRSSTS